MNTSLWIKLRGVKKYNRWQAGLVHAFKTKPGTDFNEIAIKLELDIPDELFEQPELKASIVIPKDCVNRPVIDAKVQDNIAQILSKKTGLGVRITYEDSPS